MTGESILFWVLAPLAVAASIAMLFMKKAVHSAILLAWVMITLAIFYIALEAPFLGIVQIVVYTGAVMMLFLFILMLVGVDSSDSLVEKIKGIRAVAIFTVLGFAGALTALIARADLGREPVGLSAANQDGNVEGLAALLFGDYVWAFEVISALLITAALGASWHTLKRAMLLGPHSALAPSLASVESRLRLQPDFRDRAFMHVTTRLIFQRYCQMENHQIFQSQKFFIAVAMSKRPSHMHLMAYLKLMRRVRSNESYELLISLRDSLLDWRSRRCCSS